MISTRRVLVLALLALGCAFSGLLAFAEDDLGIQVDLAYERFQLDNGLTVLVHTDHSTPTVFVGLWYGVGSKNEPEGKTGFAHLYEHLMFQGSENRQGEYFTPFTDAGATGMNGTTSEDRTNYYATVPSGALDMALWMESDRMAHLLGAITQEALDEQRAVVQNEKRQSETRPYAQMGDKIRAGLYPVDHPYRHSVIGSMDDLNSASLDDVHDWFKTYYGASNAILVLAGDVTLVEAKAKAAHYFAEAPSGAPLSEAKKWIPDLVENREETMHDNVGQTRISRTWALPGLNDKDTSLMYLVNDSLVANKNSPLRKALVDDLQLATSVRGSALGRTISGEYSLTIDLRDGVTTEQVMPVVDRIIAQYLSDGPDEQIVENAKLAVKMYILGALETGSKIGRTLARGELFSDDPLFINTELEWLNAASAEDLRQVAGRWLARGYYQLTVEAFPDYESTDATVDRSVIPAVTARSDIVFPPIETAMLNNGIKLVIANRGSIPLVDVSIRIDTGATAAPADAPGLPVFVFGLMDKGTKRHDASELAAAKDKIAMGGNFAAGDERSSLSYRILNSNLNASLGLAAEMLRDPVFPEQELEKVKARLRAYLSNLKHAPSTAANSLFNRALYGPDSVKGSVWTPRLVEQVDRASLQRWHAAEIAPDNMTVYMIGDINLDDATKAVNKAFGKWSARNNSARRDIGAATDSGNRVILIDHPGAASSTVIAGRSIAPFDATTWSRLSMMNRVIGGAFEARLNMNLREDKSWSYGYYSGISRNNSGDMVFQTSGQVQTDKTAASMLEIRRELEDFVSSRPATVNEIARIKLNRVRSLPGSFASNAGFLGSIISSDSYGLPYNHAETAAVRIEAVSRAEVHAAAENIVDSRQLTWLVVGDLEKMEQQVRELGFGDVEVWDAFGSKLR